MSEDKTVVKDVPVQPVIKKLYCKDCDTEMESTGQISPVSPPVYNYKCPKCKLKHSSSSSYPTISFEEVDG